MKTIAHNDTLRCPRCRRSTYCDDCARCAACGFAAPDVVMEQPPPPAPKRCCAECGRTSAHAAVCSVTVRAAAN